MPLPLPLMRAVALAVGIAGLAVPVTAGSQQAEGVLTIDVGNVRVARGTVHIDICPQAQFLKDNCPWAADAPAQVGVTRLVVRHLPPGRYAAQAFLDENNNKEVDRALFGIPEEGVGFSNDAKIGFGPPKFADAVFTFNGPSQAIRFNLRYFLGAKGPPTKR